MNKVLIESGKAEEWAAKYRGKPFHALLCDAPYHLETIVKRFGKEGAAPVKLKHLPNQGTSPYARGARGFMGKTWDGGDVAFRPETWAAFLSIMYPGAFGMSFASSRGWHRLAVAIEDAGFIIHPSIFGWAYGSGFPKATRVNHGSQGFEGHRYGLQALKPALEPIIVFQRPYEGRPVDNITQTGAGVLNVDGGRIPANPLIDDMLRPVQHSPRQSQTWEQGSGFKNETNPVTGVPEDGRWPANFILMDEGAAAALDAQSGSNCGAGGQASGPTAGKMGCNGIWNPASGDRDEPPPYYADSGGASRFFFRVSEQLDEADPVRYCAKASRSERDAGLDSMQDHSLGHNRFDKCAKCGGYIFQNKDRPSACKCEQPERMDNTQRNPHPTVKPLSLAKYLATLLLPPAQFAPRRLFVPFAGVASEMIGAMQAGWEEVTGVELTEEYIPIARARVDYWAAKPVQVPMELG